MSIAILQDTWTRVRTKHHDSVNSASAARRKILWSHSSPVASTAGRKRRFPATMVLRLIKRLGRLQGIIVLGLILTVFVICKQVYDTEGRLTVYGVGSDVLGKTRCNDPTPVNSSYYVKYNHNAPLIWVGGVPRSGTTLARAMLDAHPDIRCGEETRVIPRMLGMHAAMMKSSLESQRLSEAKITSEVLEEALGAYMLSIITHHGESAQRLCNKDPFTLRSMTKILKIFPNSKFLLMVRDGRATVHSIISRKVSIKGFNVKSYSGAMADWNRSISTMWEQCETVGPERCLPVYYEQLVLHPRATMNKVLEFLQVPWDDRVIHHEQTIGRTGGVSLSKRELSTDQVNKPVNLGSLTSWAESFPTDARQDIDNLAPMLSKLGYDSHAFPPNYGTPDPEVLEQSEKLKQEGLMNKIEPIKFNAS